MWCTRRRYLSGRARPKVRPTRLRGISSSRSRATRLRGISTCRDRDSSPRNIHVVCAAPRPRLVSAEYPRGYVRRRDRDSSPRNIHVVCAAPRPSSPRPRRLRTIRAANVLKGKHNSAASPSTASRHVSMAVPTGHIGCAVVTCDERRFDAATRDDSRPRCDERRFEAASRPPELPVSKARDAARATSVSRSSATVVAPFAEHRDHCSFAGAIGASRAKATACAQRATSACITICCGAANNSEHYKTSTSAAPTRAQRLHTPSPQLCCARVIDNLLPLRLRRPPPRRRTSSVVAAAGAVWTRGNAGPQAASSSSADRRLAETSLARQAPR